MDLTIKCRIKHRIFKIKTTHQNPYRILNNFLYAFNLQILFPIYIFCFQSHFTISNVHFSFPIYEFCARSISMLLTYNFSNVCFPYIYRRFSDSHCLVLWSCDVVWWSTSLVLWKYRCSCVKSSKIVSISKMNIISSQKVKTAKVRKAWIGRTLFDWISNR